ncbi:MAG: FAD-dependent oxidoreductase [Flavobacteriales bacterium]|nr:FAD-dependent oxidoreductase [Flavobacteriales bacterium]MDW8432664.1 NAD(P)/FAD-dependent oxidoreductase [Flavobacteriales bacterium]
MIPRRQFIRLVTGATAGLVVGPGCSKSRWPGPNAFNGRILIVGAGSAGLYAGYLLQAYGIDFEILEAQARHGGRLLKLEGFATTPLDLGAAWLHGRHNLAADLVRKFQFPLREDTREPTFWFQGQKTPSLPQSPYIFEGTNLPDISFLEFSQQKGLLPDYQWIVEAIAAEYGASAGNISVYQNAVEGEKWTAGEEDFVFQTTYFDFIHQYIAIPVLSRIRYNTPITQIDYSGPGVVLKDANSKTYTGDVVLITIPISLLKAGAIEFYPPLPPDKVQAFSKIGMDPCIKFFLKFQNRFFDPYLMGGAVCGNYFDATWGREAAEAVLMGMVMGNQALFLQDMGSAQAMTEALLQELDSIYGGQASSSFVAAHFQNWTSEPYIRGGYSFGTVQMGNARALAASSVDNKVFFAGEAMNRNGHHQTVHGAMETAWQALLEILR